MRGLDSDHGRRGILLPIRPKPFGGESSVGYLIRVAQANGYSRPRQLRRIFSNIDALFEALVISEGERQQLIGPFPGYWHELTYKAQLAISDFNHHRLRWCPECLGESSFLRGVWSLKLQCVCPLHGAYLLDFCEHCGRPQGLERSSLTICECGKDLRSSPTRPSDPNLLRIGSVLQQAFSNGRASVLPGFELSTVELLRLIRFLGGFSEGAQAARPGQVANLHLLETAQSLVAGLGHVLGDWPQRFHAILGGIQSRETQSVSLRRTFSSIYRVLYRELREPAFQFLRDAFECYINEHWWGLVCKRNRLFQPNTIQRHPRLTLKDAAKRSSVSPAAIRHMVQADLIPSDSCEHASGRRFLSLPQESFTIAQGAMNLQETAKAVALPERRVKELVQAGVLTPLISKPSSKAASWLFSRGAIDRLTNISCREDGAGRLVVLAKVLKVWRLRTGEFAALINEILSGQIVPIGEGTTAIGSIKFSMESIRLWLYDHRVAQGALLSVDGAARFLGIKQQVAYELVARNLLPFDSSQPTNKGISIAALREFQDAYVSLAELARKEETSPKVLLKKILAIPVTGPTVDGGRQYFFRRIDLIMG